MDGSRIFFFSVLILALFITFLTPVIRADYMDPVYCRVYGRTSTSYMVECSIDIFKDNGSLLYIFSYENMSWNSLNISMIKSVYYNNYAVLLTFYNETDNNGNPISVVISSLDNTVYGDLNASDWTLEITWGYWNGSQFETITEDLDLTPVNGYYVHIENQSYLIASILLNPHPVENNQQETPAPPTNPRDILGWIKFIAYLIAIGIQLIESAISFLPSVLWWILKITAILVLIIPVHILIAFVHDPVSGASAVKFWYNLFKQLAEWLVHVVNALANLIKSLIP